MFERPPKLVIPLSGQDLLKYPIPDNVNIEDGLCRPEDFEAFMQSSIAFLQKQLIRTMRGEIGGITNEDRSNKSYSNLLIVKAGNGHQQGNRYIRLTNVDKFEEIQKNESSLPFNALSSHKILPVPKNPRSHKLLLSRLFKSKPRSKTITTVSPSIFSIFKRSNSSLKGSTKSESTLEFQNGTGNVSSTNLNVVHDNFESSPISSTTSTKLDTNTSSTTSNLVCKDHKCISVYSNSNENLNVIREQEDIINPTALEVDEKLEEKISVKSQSVDEEQTVSSFNNFIHKENDYYEDPETGIEFKCVPARSHVARKSWNRDCQSKLSVYLEEDEEEIESDVDAFTKTRRYPQNCTDDVKTIISSETVDTIMHQLLIYIDHYFK